MQNIKKTQMKRKTSEKIAVSNGKNSHAYTQIYTHTLLHKEGLKFIIKINKPNKPSINSCLITMHSLA